jgi:hypothetical protein
MGLSLDFGQSLAGGNDGSPSSATWLAMGLVSSEGSLDVIDDIERSGVALGNRRYGSDKGRP